MEKGEVGPCEAKTLEGGPWLALKDMGLGLGFFFVFFLIFQNPPLV